MVNASHPYSNAGDVGASEPTEAEVFLELLLELSCMLNLCECHMLLCMWCFSTNPYAFARHPLTLRGDTSLGSITMYYKVKFARARALRLAKSI